jgi:hypothetical protein
MLTGSTTNLVASDLVSRPQNFNIVQSPPKNFFTQTYWTQLSVNFIQASSTSAIVENNISITINGFPGAAAYLATFDQYCIYSSTVNFAYLQENSAVTSSVQNVRVHTALDYDNVANIGLNSLTSYSTYSVTELSPNTSVIRYVKPCVSDSLIAGSSPQAGSGIQRRWIDSAFNNITHYGVRCIFGITALSVVSIDEGISIVVGFRNGI